MSQAALVLPVAGPASPDHPPVPGTTPEQSHDEDPFNFLSTDALQGMRDEQKRILTEEQDKVENKMSPTDMKEAADRAKARYDELYKDYLRSHNVAQGLDEDDPKFEEYLNYIAQVGNMTDDEWRTGEYRDGEKVNESGRDMIDDLHDHLLEEHRAEPEADTEGTSDDEEAAPNLPPAPDDTAELPLVPTPVAGERRFTPEQMRDLQDKVEARNEAHATLMTARDHLAELTVKRQGKLRDKESPEYREAQRAYQEAMINYGKAGEQMLGAMQEDRPDDQKRADAVEYLLHESAELRKITNEKWNNTTVNKICSWMARGNLAQRIAKGMLVGAGVSATAAAVGAVTGGTGLLTVAGAGAAAARVMRAYGSQRGRNLVKGNAATDMTGVPGHTPEARRDYLEQQRTELHSELRDSYSPDAVVEVGARLLLEKHEDKIGTEQKKNRRSAYMSIGALVVPAVATYAGAEVLEHHAHFREAVSNKLHDWFGGGHKPEVSQLAPKNPGTPTPGPEIIPQPAPSADELLKQLTPDQLNALNIKPGEGGIRLMESIGAKPSDWYSMQDDLLKAHPHDFYRMPDGNVGLAHTGRLSNDTMVDIATHLGLVH